MNVIQAVILAIIEGLTEFLPVSSTGHMIIASWMMGISTNDFTKLFEISIQLGAILAVLFLYFKRFFNLSNFNFSFIKFLFTDQKQFVQGLLNNFLVKLFIAFIPAAIFGVLLSDKIDSWLENPMGVAIALIVGGVVLLYVDQYFAKNESNDTSIEKDINSMTAFKIGFFQVLALFPGVSRSASTIVGGLVQKLNRKTAAEFSFFLAVPTMIAATGKKTLEFYLDGKFISTDYSMLIWGNIIAFVVAIIAIKSFIGFLNKYGFKIFGIYRIGVGIITLILIALSKMDNL
jgi:undecaprenyl-diphosphatase